MPHPAAPRALDDEARGRVAEDDERVAAVVGRRLHRRDRPVRLAAPDAAPAEPAVVADGARVEHADVVQGDVHVRHGSSVDPIVGAERAAGGVQPPVVLGLRGRPGHVRAVPQIEATDAVLVPALHGAAQARAGVLGGAGKLVVAAGHRVEHERRHRRRLRIAMLAEQEIHDAREREAGARVRLPLIEHGQLELGRHLGRRRLVQHRNVGSVAQVQAIGNDVALGIERRAPARRRHSWHRASSPPEPGRSTP